MEKRISLNDNNSGFTLVEVLISILILAIIVTSATSAFVYAARVSKDNKFGLTAVNLANDMVEYIRSLEFAEVGTKIVIGGTVIYGDPSGDILQTQIKEVDGTQYVINTTISWEEQGGWDLGDTDWDYKSVKVSVVPKGFEGDTTLTKVIETFVTRDSTQPALTGANISLRLIRGWNTVPGVKVPVANSKVSLTAGPSAPRQVQTSSGGVARFIDLTTGSYTVSIDPSNLGMMLHPDQAEDWVMSIANGVTQTKEFEVEFPCSLKITLRDLAGNPISMDADDTAEVLVQVPYGSPISKNITASDIDAQGSLPLNFLTGLWPVGLGYTGAYTITDVSISECQYFGSYELIGSGETLWSGKFEGPGTSKNITCYFGTIPGTPSDIITNWVNGNTIMTGTGPYIAYDSEGENIYAGMICTTEITESITIPLSSTTAYNATGIYFENKGTETVPGLYVRRRSKLNLHTGLVIIRGETEFQDSDDPENIGKITLSTTYEDGTFAPSVDGDLIGGTAGLSYGKLYLAKPMVIEDSTILEPGGYYFYNGIELPNNASELIPITKDNFIN